MCGIFGYKGRRNAGEIILNGLKALEYRGYDSWGISLKTKKGIFIKKDIGKISGVNLKTEKSNTGIGHTRWATHGGVTKKNSHPHHDPMNRFFVAHNGIIENAEGLKRKFKLKDFYSQTDSEVIPHLINFFSTSGKMDFEKAVKETAKQLKGNFAFVVIDKLSDKMIAARNGSPLIIGFKENEKNKENEYFISSDMPSFLRYTKDVYFLNDGEMAVIGKDIKFQKIRGKEIKKKYKTMDLDIESSMKGKYEHFMLKEIYEQPEVIEETMRGYMKEGQFLFDKDDRKINRVVIIACGTSWHAGLVGEYWIESFAKIPVEVEYASEFRYRNPIINKDTVVITISQSGETADTIAAMKEAKKKSAKIISICNVVGSTIDRMSDISLYTRAGPEIGVASTKAFTTQMTILFLMALHLSRNAIKKKDLARYLKELKRIPNKMRKVLKESGKIKKVMKKYHSKKNALFLGRGVNYPIALEGALKLKEISYIHAEGYPAAEMKHGPIALIDKDLPSVFISIKDRSYEKVMSNIQEVKARKGKVIAIATEKDNKIKRLADDIIYVPNTIEELTPFLTVVPLQILSYMIAKEKGCEIDKPRNLAKSVTVE